MITKIAFAGLLAVAPVLAPSTASAQVVQTPCEWAQLQDGTWICTPDAPQTYTYDDTPYAYYYVPNIGWGWHVAPWGFGHPWHGRWTAAYGHYTPRYYHGGAHYYSGAYHGGGGAHFSGGHAGGGHAGGGHGGGGHR